VKSGPPRIFGWTPRAYAVGNILKIEVIPMAETSVALPQLLKKHETSLLTKWQAELDKTATKRISPTELQEQTREFLRLLTTAVVQGTDIDGPSWEGMRGFLEDVSRTRCLQGFSSTETATFLLSLKKPIFELMQNDGTQSTASAALSTWSASELIDRLGLYSIQSYQQTRESVIERQQEEMLELSTPVVKLWDGILALPMIGTLDSARTQVVMESLLQRIVETGAELAIIDITGVPTVDTLVAQHLLKTVAAIRLMGADCIISGVRPQIAQTIVHLGVDLQGVITKATLADALSLAFRRGGYTVTKKA
jgi:rsbT co-antagonist protein RsbR